MSFWHRHKWSDWLVTDRGTVLYAHQPVGWYAVQERHCHQCGKTEVQDQANYGGNGKSWCTRRSDIRQRAPRKDGVLSTPTHRKGE